MELGEFADWTMNFVHQGVGGERTKKFKLANIAALYPEERIVFNHTEILSNLEKIANEDVMFAKTKTMRDHDALGGIVSRLGNPDEEELQRLIDAGILNLSHRDIQGKNFLDNSKLGVFNSTVLSTRLLDNFWETVCEKSEMDREATVNKAYELLGDTMWAVMGDTADDRGEFILYNTVSFLLSDGQESMETIAQAVMLEESGIAKRVTTAFATAPNYAIDRPHHLKASQLLAEALETDLFKDWSSLTQGNPPIG